MITMSFVESDVVWEECGCFMVLSEVVLDGAYLLFVGDDVIFCNLVIRVFLVVVAVLNLVVVGVGLGIVLGVPSTLINNVKFPV